MFKVTLHNSAGPLEEKKAATEEDAAKAAIAIIKAIGWLGHGDKITIEELDE